MSTRKYQEITWEKARITEEDYQREPQRVACAVCGAHSYAVIRYDGRVAFGCEAHHEQVYSDLCAASVPDLEDIWQALQEVKQLLQIHRISQD